jgi:hypothetical protein
MLMLGLFDAPPDDGGKLILDASDATSCAITKNAHGDERLTAAVKRPLAEVMQIYDQSGLLWAGLLDGGRVLWLGRLEDPGVFAGPDGSGMQIQALGAWRALSDDRYTALWSTTSVAAWVESTAAMSGAYVQATRWGRDTNNRLYIELIKGNTYALNQASGLLYFAPHQGTRTIVGIQFQVAITLPTTMTMRVVGFNDSSPPGGTLVNGVAHVAFVGTGALVDRAYHLNLSGNPRNVVGVDVLCNTGATPAGETGANNVTITKLRIVSSIANRVNTSLTANLTAGSNVSAQVGSTVGMYVGMELAINSGATSGEIVTVESITDATHFVADFTFNYTSGQTVQGFRILADEIATDIVDQVSTLNPAQLSSSVALLQSPGLDLMDEVYEDAGPAEVLRAWRRWATPVMGAGKSASRVKRSSFARRAMSPGPGTSMQPS